MPISGISYHDYLFMVAALDAEWTRNPQDAGKAQQDSFKHFRDICSNYRKQITRNDKSWHRSNNLPLSDDHAPADWLFSPLEWIPCGHSDALCFSLVDDLDAAQVIIEKYPKTVEEISVAFCPKISPFVENLDPMERAIFVELHDWFSVTREGERMKAPLLHFARLKIQGILTLGRALSVLEACYQVFIQRIVEAVGIIRSTPSPLIDAESDFESLRICILDLQEEEEIGILFLPQIFPSLWQS